jgi:hypothetical protein
MPDPDNSQLLLCSCTLLLLLCHCSGTRACLMMDNQLVLQRMLHQILSHKSSSFYKASFFFGLATALCMSCL